MVFFELKAKEFILNQLKLVGSAEDHLQQCTTI